MSALRPSACPDLDRGSVGLVLAIAAVCIGTCVVVALVFCAPRVL